MAHVPIPAPCELLRTADGLANPRDHGVRRWRIWGEAMDLMTADATLAGVETSRLLLADVPSPITLRELIRLRVREEVAAHNGSERPRFNGLVEPSERESVLNGYPAESIRLDWEEQAEHAVTAFGRNGFFVFVGPRQVEELDEELTFTEADTVSFVRILPLVGG